MAQFAKGGLPFQITNGQSKAGEMAIARVLHIPNAANETFILQDGSGNTVLPGKSVGSGAQLYDFGAMPLEVNGLGLTGNPAGQVWVYLAE
jgi:hypothetical protein